MLNLLLLIFTLLIPLDNKTSTWLNFGGGFNLTTFFLVFFLFAWFINSDKVASPHKNPLNKIVFIFILIVFISLWVGSSNFGYSIFGATLNSYKRFITTFLVYFLIHNMVKNKKTMNLLFLAMVFMTMFMALIALKGFRSSWHYDEGNRVQMLGMNPNSLGGFFMQLVPVLMSFAISLKKLKSQIFYFFMFLLTILAVMFTYSRGAYLSAIVSLLVITFMSGKKTFMKIGISSLAALFIISVFFGSGRILPISVQERFEMASDKDKREVDESVKTRENIWAITIDYISQSPIYGHGYDASGYLLPADTHNMYLDLLLESGIIALIFFVLIFLIGFKIAYSVFKNYSDEFEKALSLGFIGTLVAVFVGNFFGTRMNNFASNGYFAILMGMVARLYTEKRKLGIIKR